MAVSSPLEDDVISILKYLSSSTLFQTQAVPTIAIP